MTVGREPTYPIGTAIILAAGASERFGSDKRCTPFAHTTLLQYTLEIYAKAFSRILVVLREQENILAESSPLGTHAVYTANAHSGISQSLRAGIQDALQEPWVVVGLMDMPYVNVATLQALTQRMEATSASVVRLRYQQQYGNPVGFKQECYPQLCELTGDQGARTLFKTGNMTMEALEVNDRGILLDIDTPAQLREYVALLG